MFVAMVSDENDLAKDFIVLKIKQNIFLKQQYIIARKSRRFNYYPLF